MRRARVIGALIAGVTALYSKPEEPLAITIGRPIRADNKAQRMLIFVGIVGPEDRELDQVVAHLQKDLERSGQFELVYKYTLLPTSKADIQELFKKGYALAFFINKAEEGKALEWRLYDTGQSLMVKGKKYYKTGSSTLGWAHALAHEMWPELMGEPGPFATRLCYIKKVPNARHKWLNQVCTCDVRGELERVIFSTPRIIIAPCWGIDKERPYIVCSEFTQANVRLVAVTPQGKKHVLLDFDGTTVGVSFGSGADLVYGRSGGIWRYRYDSGLKKSIHSLLIKEKSACACPTLLSNGDVIYCSEGKIKRYDNKTGQREVVQGEGYSVGPTCHEKTGKIVYSRRVKGAMQLFIHDIKTGKSEQLTFDKGDKVDACYSPCGAWVAFCVEQRGKGSIVTLNIKTKKRYMLTREGDNCRYPAWSPIYEQMNL
jgi:Tol biopolymer transport system component